MMNDFPQNSVSSDTQDAVMAYQPPTAPVVDDGMGMAAAPAVTQPTAQEPMAYQPPMQGSEPAPSFSQPMVSTQPPAMSTAPAPQQAAPVSGNQPDPESLEAQNIFELLGVGDGSDAEKESFLDELQQVIWEDFLANDLQLLLTRDELSQVREMQASTTDQAKLQEELVMFLERLIPDLEDIMLEKALELKREMVSERMKGMQEHLSGQTDKLSSLEAARALMAQNKWASTAKALNALSNS